MGQRPQRQSVHQPFVMPPDEARKGPMYALADPQENGFLAEAMFRLRGPGWLCEVAALAAAAGGTPGREQGNRVPLLPIHDG